MILSRIVCCEELLQVLDLPIFGSDRLAHFRYAFLGLPELMGLVLYSMGLILHLFIGIRYRTSGEAAFQVHVRFQVTDYLESGFETYAGQSISPRTRIEPA